MMKTKLKAIGKQVGIVLLVLTILAIVFALGLVIGYGVIGNGKDPWSILSPDTWKEILQKFSGK